MDGYGPGSYGASFADVYDDWYGDISDVGATVDGIRALADGGPVLELGVGTGRLALPLAAAGVDLVGLDASSEMITRLSRKPGARSIPLVRADMAEPPVRPGRFALAFAAFNTFFNLTDDKSQRACAVRVADLLRPGGRFAVEGFVPPADGMPDGGVSVRDVTIDAAVVTLSRHDAATQTIRGQHVQLGEAGIRMRPWVLRYLTPVQLDDLLRDAGLELESRHADWAGSAYREATSETHVSVYRR